MASPPCPPGSAMHTGLVSRPARPCPPSWFLVHKSTFFFLFSFHLTKPAAEAILSRGAVLLAHSAWLTVGAAASECKGLTCISVNPYSVFTQPWISRAWPSALPRTTAFTQSPWLVLRSACLLRANYQGRAQEPGRLPCCHDLGHGLTSWVSHPGVLTSLKSLESVLCASAPLRPLWADL